MCRHSEPPQSEHKSEAAPVSLSPWITLVLGGVIGYAVAFVLHHGETTESHSSVSWTTDAAEDAPAIISSAEEETSVVEEEGRVLDTTVAMIVFFLIVLTILFESVKESIEEAADKAMKPVLEGLFGELTVLGFLSTVTFCITKLGWFSKISEFLFGEEEEEELLEIFETVHFMLFFIMVFFVVTVLVLLKGGEETERTWWNFNRACRDRDFMSYLERLHPAGDNNDHTTYWKFLMRQLFPFLSSKQQLRSELTLFRGLRHEFLVERDQEPPFALSSDPNRLRDDFDFGLYLSVCLGHELGHVVHLQMSTWLFLAGVTAVFYVIAIFVENQLQTFAWVWVAAGWLCFILGTFFDYHMVQILEGMASNHIPSDSSESSYLDASEHSSLLGNQHRASNYELPKWTNINLGSHLQNERSWLARMVLPEKMITTRQDCLYWMERKGPKLYMILFQIQMVFTAAYTALLLMTMIPYVFEESDLYLPGKCLYVVFSMLPVCLLLSKYQTAAANLTMACSIGVHRRPQVIAQVVREEKTSRIIRAMVSMQKLQQAAQGGFSSTEIERFHQEQRSTVNRKQISASMSDLSDSQHVFNSLDASGDGNIETSELGDVLRKLGAPITQECLEGMINLLDVDGDGVISQEEFHWFYKAYVVVELDENGLKALAKNMFAQMDKDGRGEISPCEFKTVLDAFNVGFTMDEVGELIDELDENGDGEIGEHEFIQLLETHRVLFQNIPLPELE